MKDKIIIIVIAILSFVTASLAIAQTCKNCGNPTWSAYCSDSGFRIDFDNTTFVNNAEIDFNTVQPIFGSTTCSQSGFMQISMSISSDGSHINLYPIAPLTSLQGLHDYIVCYLKNIQAR